MSILYKIVIVALSICLVVSLIVNFFFIKGKGIQIDRSITNHQEQYQQQWQGQLLINQFMIQGNTIEWKEVVVNKENTLSNQLNKLHPISALYAKLLPITTDVGVLIYPDIFTKTKETITK